MGDGVLVRQGAARWTDTFTYRKVLIESLETRADEATGEYYCTAFPVTQPRAQCQAKSPLNRPIIATAAHAADQVVVAQEGRRWTDSPDRNGP